MLSVTTLSHLLQSIPNRWPCQILKVRKDFQLPVQRCLIARTTPAIRRAGYHPDQSTIWDSPSCRPFTTSSRSRKFTNTGTHNPYPSTSRPPPFHPSQHLPRRPISTFKGPPATSHKKRQREGTHSPSRDKSPRHTDKRAVSVPRSPRRDPLPRHRRYSRSHSPRSRERHVRLRSASRRGHKSGRDSRSRSQHGHRKPVRSEPPPEPDHPPSYHHQGYDDSVGHSSWHSHSQHWSSSDQYNDDEWDSWGTWKDPNPPSLGRRNPGNLTRILPVTRSTVQSHAGPPHVHSLNSPNPPNPRKPQHGTHDQQLPHRSQRAWSDCR